MDNNGFGATGEGGPSISRSIVLIILWFIPDFLSASPVFPIESVATASGLHLAALLTTGVAGALLLLVALLPLPHRIERVLSGSVALMGAILVTAPVDNHLPIAGPAALYLCLGSMVTGGAIRRCAETATPPRIVLALLPAAAILTVLFGSITGTHSPAYLVSFKTPITIYVLAETAMLSLVPPKSRSTPS